MRVTARRRGTSWPAPNRRTRPAPTCVPSSTASGAERSAVSRSSAMSRQLVRHAQATAEFVVDEPVDSATPVSLEAPLAIELGRRENVLPARGEDVPLPARVTHEPLALASHDHPMFGAVRESILADELVEHAGPHTASEGLGGCRGEEGLGDASRKQASEPKARGVDALTREADAHAQ